MTDPRFRDQLAGPVLIARCENVREPDGQECHGRLRYRWGQIEAACDTCGGRCGIAVAAWLDVQPTAEVEARVQAAAAAPLLAKLRAVEEITADLEKTFQGSNIPVRLRRALERRQ